MCGLCETLLDKKSDAAYGVRNIRLFDKRISGITDQRQLVWETVKFVAERVDLSLKWNHTTCSEKAFYNKKYIGWFNTIASMTAFYLNYADIKDAGVVISEGLKKRHWNYVKLDGKYYYFNAFNANLITDVYIKNSDGVVVDFYQDRRSEEEAMNLTLLDAKEYISKSGEKDYDDWVYYPCGDESQFTVKGNNR